MNEIASLLKSPAFWFASVVLGFLMSFFASYAKEWTDHLFEKRSRKHDEEARLRQHNFDKTVARLKTNPHLLALYQTNIIYQKLRQVLYLVVSYMGVALAVFALADRNVGAALACLSFSVVVSIFTVRAVSKRLQELRSVVNEALGDEEKHFVG